MYSFFKNKSVLITGGTGSFGSMCVELLLKKSKLKRLVVFSRDELKQHELSKKFSSSNYPIRYFIGDVRDKDRLIRACNGIDYIIHTAAMKQVLTSEYNPTECIATYIIGAQNIIDAALHNNIKKVIAYQLIKQQTL